MKATRYLLVLVLVLIVAIGMNGAQGVPPSDEPQPEPEREKVTLIVDFGDGFEKRYTALPWKVNLTVLDVLQQARDHRYPTQFEFRGRGAATFLVSIDGVANEGTGRRNWIYRVNDKKGERSCAVFPVARGDIVLWRLEKYE